MTSGDLVVAGRVHLSPAEPDEVGIAAAEPDEVGVDATADGRDRVSALYRRRPIVERPAKPHEVLVHGAAPGQRVHRPQSEPFDRGGTVGPVRGRQCSQRQRHWQQAQQHGFTCNSRLRAAHK